MAKRTQIHTGRYAYAAMEEKGKESDLDLGAAMLDAAGSERRLC